MFWTLERIALSLTTTLVRSSQLNSSHSNVHSHQRHLKIRHMCNLINVLLNRQHSFSYQQRTMFCLQDRLSQFPTILTTFNSINNFFKISFVITTLDVLMKSDSFYYISKEQVKTMLITLTRYFRCERWRETCDSWRRN